MAATSAGNSRLALYLSLVGLAAMAAAVASISADAPDGVALRAAMIVATAVVALGLPWPAVLPAAFLVWLAPHYALDQTGERAWLDRAMLLELPGLLGLAIFALLARRSLRGIEDERLLAGAAGEGFSGVDPLTGVHEERLLRPALEAELARARRFDRQLALVLVGVDELRQRFDYRDGGDWAASFHATASLLRSTRLHIDRVYRHGSTGFALLLPESGEREVRGLIRRLRRVGRLAKPAEGEPGGALPTHFGATFFPDCATTTDDMLRRAEVALRLAEKSSSRLQLDSAEAPDLPAPETMRKTDAAEADALKPEEIEEAKERSPEAAAAPEAARSQPVPLFADRVPDAATGESSADNEAEALGEPANSLPPVKPFTIVPRIVFQEELASADKAPEPLDAEESAGSPEPERAAEAADEPEPADESFDDVMRHLDETLAMIRSLRSGSR